MSEDCLDLGLSFSTECVKKTSLRIAQGNVALRHFTEDFLVGIYH